MTIGKNIPLLMLILISYLQYHMENLFLNENRTDEKVLTSIDICLSILFYFYSTAWNGIQTEPNQDSSANAPIGQKMSLQSRAFHNPLRTMI